MTRRIVDEGTALARAQRLCADYGCTLTRRGRAWRVQGPATDLLIADLRALAPSDLTASAASASQRRERARDA